MKTNQRPTPGRAPARHNAGQRRKLIEDFNRSGCTQAEFCRRRGLNARTFNGWLRATRKTAPSFAEVDMPMPPEHGVEIELPNGIRVLVRGGAQHAADLIRRVSADFGRETSSC